ncbi:hypothetical protein [Streptomyces sp. AK08-02]|uniref:hypothetical protein n=1 Tax=Streptomyces sp. AK08-02 TaxID=3028654 RepID=UPI0029BDA1FD|nr:hypothetical protein [Streptomyces sp. AK08-02]
MSLHAIEITLVRPAVKKELKAARRESRLPLVVSADQVRLLTVICAANRQAALRGVWAALENLLPIDALWTAYADKDGMHLLSVQVSEEVHARVQDAAAVAGQDPDEYVKQSLLDAIARDQANAAARLNPQDRQGRDEDRLRGHQPPARTGQPGATRRTRPTSLVS